MARLGVALRLADDGKRLDSLSPRWTLQGHEKNYKQGGSLREGGGQIGRCREAGGILFSYFLRFVFRSFFVRLFRGLGGSFGGHWVDLGAIWGAFWCNFRDFFRIRWIFKNVCFIIVKPYFLRSGRVLDRDFFVLCFWIYTFI